ncbi:kinase-like domain-containing protein [Gigaspora rosea]|uniref:Kinase-like domain-containing protein n=1 Tax=Gigaspora rosea TaxID=44941 RepID=A0A397W838_9GLOM|nr:kinase-like domain-containing protein [Gigaspora rosea]
MTTKISEDWLINAISEEHISYYEYDKFSYNERISDEGLGSVSKYDWEDYELTVALKCLNIDMNSSKETIHNFIYELKLLQKVHCHPNIITFYGITKDRYNGYYNIILEYADEGNLREYLKTNFMRLQWTDKFRIAKEIVLGLLFLHDNNIIHRDLHSMNILFHQGQPKIADFGLSNSIVHGLSAYIDPQCFKVPKYKRNMKSDIYSLGVIFWEISSGRPPFESFMSRESLMVYILSGNREESIEGTPIKYIELYKQCWDNEPDNRPGTKLVLETLKKFITNNDLNQLNRQLIKYSEDSSLNKQKKKPKVNLQEILKSNLLYLPDTLNSTNLNEVVDIANKDHLKNSKTFGDNTITSLNLKNSQLGPDDIKIFAKAFCKNSTLTSLNLSWNNLGSEGGKILAEALCKNNVLNNLNLTNNKLGLEGGKALSKALFINQTLTSLNLCCNNIGSEKGKVLAEALCTNTKLNSLNLTNNKLGPEGGKALANTLLKNTTLTSLIIATNNIGPEGGKAFAETLYKNTSLKSLSLEKNRLGSEVGKALASALSSNTTLTFLNLNENDFDSVTKKLLNEIQSKDFDFKF